MLQIKQRRVAAGKKSRKAPSWKFTLDLTHPVEDGILDSANFVSPLDETSTAVTVPIATLN